MCPVIRAMGQSPVLSPRVCVTAQHKEMLYPVLETFGIVPDADLSLMRPNQTLAALTARAVTKIDGWLTNARPDAVLVQGDTTTAFGAALAAYYHRLPVFHVEAGLRTGDKYAPWPEEINRSLITPIADLHFAPTEQARQNLLRAGVPAETIHVTGNTVIDALLSVVETVRRRPPDLPGLPLGEDTRRIVLITGHRRENFGPGLESICRAIRELARRFPDVRFVYPVHLNPHVREPVHRLLGNRSNIILMEPLDYPRFVALMDRATLILTDSGGVQEEAPSLGKPVLVLRETTERPEAVDLGAVRLVGAGEERIVDSVSQLLTDASEYGRMAQVVHPYGDGKASERIRVAVEATFEKANPC